MSTSDLFTADYPHGTVQGYDGLDGHDGCRGGACPGGDMWGLTCKRAKQLSRSDYQYQKLAAQGLGPEEIADKLGLMPEVGETRGKPITKRAPKRKPADHAATEQAEDLRDVPGVVTIEATGLYTVETADEITVVIPIEIPDLHAATQPTPKEIRAWAIDRGYEVKPMGKLPQHIIDHYWDTHDVGATPPEVDTNSAQMDTEAPETVTIIPEPAGPRPDWSHITLTEDLARAQTERDALAEELEEANGALTRARGFAARLEEELARTVQEHAAEISALNIQLADHHNGDRQRIDQLEESLAIAELANIAGDNVIRAVRDELGANPSDDIVTFAHNLRANLIAHNLRANLIAYQADVLTAITTSTQDQAETIGSLTRALEFTIRQWAIERDRNQRHDEQLEAFRQEYETSRLSSPVVLQPVTIAERFTTAPATPNDDSNQPRSIRSLIRRGTAARR